MEISKKIFNLNNVNINNMISANDNKKSSDRISTFSIIISINLFTDNFQNFL